MARLCELAKAAMLKMAGLEQMAAGLCELAKVVILKKMAMVAKLKSDVKVQGLKVRCACNNSGGRTCMYKGCIP